MITAKSQPFTLGHIFHNAHADFAVFHVLNHAGVGRTVKKSAAFVIVNVVPDIG